MSHTLDTLATIEHGTPAGYTAGCRSNGGCTNHDSRTLLTCNAAYRTWLQYFHGKTPATSPITKEMRRQARKITQS